MLGYIGYYYDPTYFLIIIAALLSLFAQLKVKSTFARYSKTHARTGITGAEAAERILRSNGIYDVSIERISGNLTDHYDPRAKVLRLSDSVYNHTSVAAIGVAAHECGHAIQHAKNYLPLTLRSAIAPVASVGSYASWILIIIGLFFTGNSGYMFLQLGIWLFVAVVAFQLITLPVEFNASHRAVSILANNGMLYDEEVKGTKKVLTAAALTYVAAAATAMLQLLRLILIAGGRRRD
jgi:uncharacterized protein